MKGSADRITSCTTTQFDGVIAVIDPDGSWVARWQRTGPFDFWFLSSILNKFQRNMSVGCMLFALLDVYQKMLNLNSSEEILNIVLEIKLTRIKERIPHKHRPLQIIRHRNLYVIQSDPMYHECYRYI